PSTPQKRAREIMGRNYFGIEEATCCFGAKPSKTQLSALSEVPCPETMLELCRNTHILVAVFPFDILEIRNRIVGEYLGYGLQEEAFTKNRGKTAWVLVKKEAVEESTSKSWGEQQALLSADDMTPTAQVMV